jgi:hypothetical protein
MHALVVLVSSFEYSRVFFEYSGVFFEYSGFFVCGVVGTAENCLSSSRQLRWIGNSTISQKSFSWEYTFMLLSKRDICPVRKYLKSFDVHHSQISLSRFSIGSRGFSIGSRGLPKNATAWGDVAQTVICNAVSLKGCLCVVVVLLESTYSSQYFLPGMQEPLPHLLLIPGPGIWKMTGSCVIKTWFSSQMSLSGFK